MIETTISSKLLKELNIDILKKKTTLKIVVKKNGEKHHSVTELSWDRDEPIVFSPELFLEKFEYVLHKVENYNAYEEIHFEMFMVVSSFNDFIEEMTRAFWLRKNMYVINNKPNKHVFSGGKSITVSLPKYDDDGPETLPGQMDVKVSILGDGILCLHFNESNLFDNSLREANRGLDSYIEMLMCKCTNLDNYRSVDLQFSYPEDYSSMSFKKWIRQSLNDNSIEEFKIHPKEPTIIKVGKGFLTFRRARNEDR